MKVTEGMTYRLMQTNLDRITTELLGLRNQGATGLKLNKPSDDPGAIRPVLTTRTQLQQNERYLETMGHSGDKMAATDGHLSHVENILVRVKEIAISSINSAMSASDLATLADEIGELKNELLDAANAVIDGKYIFAGYQENTKPFTKNPTYNPVDYLVGDTTTWPYIYNGDHNNTSLEITPGEFIDVNLTGNEVFMGITNNIAATGSTNPYQGESLTSGPIAPGTLGNDIIITRNTDPPVTTPISGGSDLTDTTTNYAAKVAGLLSTGTGLAATVNPATSDLGSLNFAGFVDTEDTYILDLTSGGNTISVTLDGPSANFDYSLTGLADALANSGGATNLRPESGTLSNGINYDISSGSLVLTGPANGSEIELAETIVNGVVPGPVPSGGITGSNPIYGTVNIAPNSATDVTIAGTGLASIGLGPDNLSGASGRVDLFTILTRTEEAIRAGNVDNTAGAGGSIQAQIANLEIGADQNRLHRSQMGARASRVDSAILHQKDAQIDLKQILSRYQDADMIEVFNDIIQKETAFKAALSITAKVSQISILDYF